MPLDASHADAVTRGGRSWFPLCAVWVTEAWVNEPFEHQRRIDAFGHRVHTWLGVLACVCLVGPISVVELGAIPVMCAFVIRAHRHWRTWSRLFLQPVILVVLLWVALALASRLWTVGTGSTWLDDFGSLRFGFLLIALWPIADRRSLLLGAIVFGFALAQLAQLGHVLGLAFGIDWMVWDRLPGRNSGWWNPVVGGSLLTAALGLHIPAALWGSGRWRVIGVLGSCAALLGILATGSRGAWIAGAGLVVVALCAAMFCIKPRSKMVRAAGVLVVVFLVGGAVAWVAIGDQLKARFDAGRTEVINALEHQQFQSDTGARIMMNWWAIEAIRERPVTGVGIGGYEAWTRAHVVAQGVDPATRNFHGHAHNALLHAGATLGVPGLVLAVGFVVLAIVGSARRLAGDGPPGYADGPCFAIIGLLLVSAFDSIQVNAQTAALLSVLLLFAVQERPGRVDGGGAKGAPEH